MTSASLATNCKPTLGYETKSAAVIAMRAEGLTFGQIGKRLNMPSRAASSMYHRTVKRLQRAVRTVELQGNVFLDLEREAVARGMTAGEFAEELLKRIVIDKLYAAVLDE